AGGGGSYRRGVSPPARGRRCHKPKGRGLARESAEDRSASGKTAENQSPGGHLQSRVRRDRLVSGRPRPRTGEREHYARTGGRDRDVLAARLGSAGARCERRVLLYR